jgi:predicted RNase H-like HicB family nuclease
MSGSFLLDASATLALRHNAAHHRRRAPPFASARRLVHALSGLVVSAYDTPMNVEFTAVFRQVPEGYIGFVEELPGANTQGNTLEEARRNLQEAVELVLEANRELIVEATQGQSVIREPLKVSA